MITTVVYFINSFLYLSLIYQLTTLWVIKVLCNTDTYLTLTHIKK